MKRNRTEAASYHRPERPHSRGPLWIAPLLAALLVWPAAGRAQDPVESHECCIELLIPVGARTVGLGTATVSRPTIDGVFGNPAGLAPRDSGAFVVHHVGGIGSNTMGFSLLLAPRSVGSFGLSYLLFDYGSTAVTDPETGLEVGETSFRIHVLAGSYATALTETFSAGLSYAFYLSRLTCRPAQYCSGTTELNASTHLIDAGVRWTPAAVPGLEIGAAIVHLGLPLQVVNARQADRTPARVRLGAGYEVLRHAPEAAAANLELWLLGETQLHPGGTELAAGAELIAEETIFLRAGYSQGSGLTGGPAVGVGLDYERFTVAIAKTFAETTLEPGQEPFQLSFSVRF